MVPEVSQARYFPKKLTQLRSFLGACNVYHKFVEGFSKLARPLNEMLKKGADPDWQHPSEEQLQVFASLKEALTRPPNIGVVEERASAYE